MKIPLFQGVLIASFVLAALIGLFVFATHTNTSGTSTTDVGTVVIWGTLPRADMQSALTAVTQSNPSLKGVSYVQESADTLPADLATAIATGNAPDLVLASQEELQPLSKLIAPVPLTTLPVATYDATFAEGASIFAAPNGEGYYGVPFMVDPLVLYSNRAILSSSGIAKPPATWEALVGLAPSIVTLTPSRQVSRALIALGTYSNVHDARGILSTLFLQAGVPIAQYANGVLSANLSGVSGSDSSVPGQAALGFYTQFADPSKVSYTWNESLPDSQQAFLAGDLALYAGYASEAHFLSAANPNLDFAVTPLPQPATAAAKSVYGLLYAFMIPRGAKNPAGAYQAAALLTGSAAQEAAAPLLGLAPATLGALSNAPADAASASAVAYAEALYAKGWLSPAPADTDTVFSGMISGVITGRLAPDRALSTSESALTALLQK